MKKTDVSKYESYEFHFHKKKLLKKLVVNMLGLNPKVFIEKLGYLTTILYYEHKNRNLCRKRIRSLNVFQNKCFSYLKELYQKNTIELIILSEEVRNKRYHQ